MVESLLRYGISAWGAAFPTNMSVLNVTHRFILKVMLKKNRLYPTESIFNDLKLFDLAQLYIRSVLLLTYKYKELRRTVANVYYTRNVVNKAVCIPFMAKTTTQRFLTFYGPKFYNVLPLEIRTINNIKLFNRQVTKYIIDNTGDFLEVLKY